MDGVSHDPFPQAQYHAGRPHKCAAIRAPLAVEALRQTAYCSPLAQAHPPKYAK